MLHRPPIQPPGETALSAAPEYYHARVAVEAGAYGHVEVEEGVGAV